jgi:hypothetical protein
MAFKLLERRRDTILYVPSVDDQIGEGADWRAYLTTNQEAHLHLKGDPVRFRLRPAVQKYIERTESATGISRTQTLTDLNADFARELTRWVTCDIENCPEEWRTLEDGSADPIKIRVTARDRGEVVLAREIVDQLPDIVCLEVAGRALTLALAPETMRGK